ncbi:PTS system mannose-specific EIIBCA component [Bifidobacterium catenulatum]|uniref:PTS sugar transporter subunit IIA n=1 Tax=Bifidobacterium TaxID=1678 RepID=UPI00116A279E|nr:fructose PTS transporter subunit IIA [Bifidobacterium catenulatum]VUX37159.1 PTS system mannose-specific EIIBCA component [Bifidobacterium catenulatum]
MAELTLNDVLDRNTILTNVNASNKEDVFNTLIQRLYEQHYIDSVEAFTEAVHNREKEGATGIGEHIAIPHGRSESVLKNGVAIAILDHEIKWESLDDTGAKVVVLLTVGASGDGSNEHLRLLSLFARKMAKQEVTAALQQAQSADDVIAAFQD